MMLRGTIGALLVLAAWATSADAHFLFARICPPAEGGRVAEVYFSEYATAGDPRYIEKVATAEFSLQTEPGQFRPLAMRRLSDRLRAHVPVSGPLMVAGRLDYGVLTRPGLPPFLLRHYSKSVAGAAEELNKLQAHGAPLEVIGQFAADQVVLSAVRNGEPLAKAKFHIVDVNLSTEELAGDDAGKATFKPESPGVYCVYIEHLNRVVGEHRNLKYDEIREFATLTFSWPLAPQGADAEAVAMFNQALAARATWTDFPGFKAKVTGEVEGRPFSGSITVAADGGVETNVDDEGLAPWVQEQLESLTMHRAASQRPSANRPQPVVRFADDQTDHPLGRLLAFEGGHFATSYRIKGDQILVVNRVLDGKNMSITVLANGKNQEGQYLPECYTVQYWDESSGKLERTETVRDRWTRVGRWDLPAAHVLTIASDDGFCVRQIVLSEHQLLSQ